MRDLRVLGAVDLALPSHMSHVTQVGAAPLCGGRARREACARCVGRPPARMRTPCGSLSLYRSHERTPRVKAGFAVRDPFHHVVRADAYVAFRNAQLAPGCDLHESVLHDVRSRGMRNEGRTHAASRRLPPTQTCRGERDGRSTSCPGYRAPRRFRRLPLLRTLEPHHCLAVFSDDPQRVGHPSDVSALFALRR